MIFLLINIQVLSPPSTSYHPSTSPSSPSYFSINSSSNISNGGDSISSGNYGQVQQTYHRNQSFSKQSATVMSPNLPPPMPADNVRNPQGSRVSFIGQGRKPEPFSTNSSFMKVSSSFFPSVRFNSPTSSGFLPRNLRKDEMM